jgi:hypothetical protein
MQCNILKKIAYDFLQSYDVILLRVWYYHSSYESDMLIQLTQGFFV